MAKPLHPFTADWCLDELVAARPALVTRRGRQDGFRPRLV